MVGQRAAEGKKGGRAGMRLVGGTALAHGDAVRLENVSIAFTLKGGKRYVAVEGIDLGVSPGEFVAVVGPTGSATRSTRPRACSTSPASSPAC
jgi:NitT/TauT family transport system ATP-binding protein